MTPDPLGPLAEYDYLYSPTHLNDYPKWGLWPDAYYGTFRDFTGFGPFNGMTVWAIDRAALLAGDPSPTVLEVPFGVIDPAQDGNYGIVLLAGTPVDIFGIAASKNAAAQTR